MAGVLGIEPRTQKSKFRVIPFHYTPIEAFSVAIRHLFQIVGCSIPELNSFDPQGFISSLRYVYPSFLLRYAIVESFQHDCLLLGMSCLLPIPRHQYSFGAQLSFWTLVSLGVTQPIKRRVPSYLQQKNWRHVRDSNP